MQHLNVKYSPTMIGAHSQRKHAAAMYTDANRIKITSLRQRDMEAAILAGRIVSDLEAAYAENGDMDAIVRGASNDIDNLASAQDIKDTIIEIVNDTYDGLRIADAQRQQNRENQILAVRPMAVDPNAAEQDPCSSFPADSNDVNSIFAHLNDVAAVHVPNFGSAALASAVSPERQSCLAEGLSDRWFAGRTDARYQQLMVAIGNRERDSFNKDVEWSTRQQAFFIKFFNKYPNLLPAKVANLRVNIPRAAGPVQLDYDFMNRHVPDSQEVVSMALLCHYANLLHQDNLQAKVAAFVLVVDSYRAEAGINQRILDDGDLGARRDGVRPAEMGVAGFGVEDPDFDEDGDFAQGVGELVSRVNTLPAGADIHGALDIIIKFRDDVSSMLDAQMQDVDKLHQIMISLIGDDAAPHAQVSWTFMEPLLQDTRGDAQSVRERFLRSINSLVSAAERGHAMPALQWLMSKFQRSSAIKEKFGNMEVYVEVEPSLDEDRRLNVLDACVRINLANPPAIYKHFAPGGEYYEYARTRKVEDRTRAKHDREALLAQIKQTVDAAPAGNLIRTFSDTVNSPALANAVLVPARNAFNRRWPVTVKQVADVLQDFAGGRIDRASFEAILATLNPVRGVSVEDAIRTIMTKATDGQEVVQVQKAREKMGQWVRQLRKHNSAISVAEVKNMGKYLNALIGPKLKINREASIRSEMIKLARRLFLD
jgi:hypothetical protein